MPAPIIQLSKDLSVVRRDEIGPVDAMGSSSGDEIVYGRVETLTGVVNQPEMNANRALTMEIEVCPHSLVRVHVHAVHEPSRLVRADRQQTDSWSAEPFVDGPEVPPVRGVAGEVDLSIRRVDQKRSPERLIRVPD